MLLLLLVAAVGSNATSGRERRRRSRPVNEPVSLKLTLGLPCHSRQADTGFPDVAEGQSSQSWCEDAHIPRHHWQGLSHDNSCVSSAPPDHEAASPSSSGRHKSKKMHSDRYRERQSTTQGVDLTQGHNQPLSHQMHPQFQEPSAFDSNTAQMLQNHRMQQQMMQLAAHQHSHWGTQEEEQVGRPSYMIPQLQPTKSQVQSLPSGSHSGHNHVGQLQGDQATAQMIQQLEQHHIHEQGMTRPWSGVDFLVHRQALPSRYRYHSPPNCPPPPPAYYDYMMQMQQQWLDSLHKLQQIEASSSSHHLPRGKGPAQSSQDPLASEQVNKSDPKSRQPQEASASQAHLSQYAIDFLMESGLVPSKLHPLDTKITLYWRAPLTIEEQNLATLGLVANNMNSDHRTRRALPTHQTYSSMLATLFGNFFKEVARPRNFFESRLSQKAAAILRLELQNLVARAKREGDFDERYKPFETFLEEHDKKRKQYLESRASAQRTHEQKRKAKGQVPAEEILAEETKIVRP